MGIFALQGGEDVKAGAERRWGDGSPDAVADLARVRGAKETPKEVVLAIDEFLETPECEAIMVQIAIKQFHRLDGMDESVAVEFGLNRAQMRFVQNAGPGTEETGFSDALLGVDGEWRGIELHAMPTEQRVIDFEPREASREELPGAGREEDERVADEFAESLRERRVEGDEDSSFKWAEDSPEGE